MRGLAAILVAGLIAVPAIANDKRANDKREIKELREAEEVLKMSVSAPDKGIPKELLQKAECIGVFPELKKAAFVVGGEYGRGVFTCRQKDGTMGPPAFFTIGSGSVGWQFGGEEADLVLLVMNDDGMKHLLKDKFAIGGEASAAAGPVGRTAGAGLDAQMHAQLLSWSRSRGVFLGASIEGSVIKPNKKAIARFYGKPLAAREILLGENVSVPSEAQSFVKLTSQYARRDS